MKIPSGAVIEELITSSAETQKSGQRFGRVVFTRHNDKEISGGRRWRLRLSSWLAARADVLRDLTDLVGHRARAERCARVGGREVVHAHLHL